MKGKKVSDEHLHSVVMGELQDSAAYFGSEISNERADAMKRYLREPYGNEVDGKSDVVTGEVIDTIEDIMPGFIRLFTDAENLVTFEAVGADDEEQAKQETDAVHHVFWSQNSGYELLYTALKDGLLSKTGIIKAEWDDTPYESREEYRGLSPMEVMQLMNDPAVERTPVEGEETEDGLHVVFEAKASEGRVRLTVYPPEEHGVSADARSPNIKEAPFSWVRGKVSKSDLIQQGYDKDKVESIPNNTELVSEEELARRAKLDEQSMGGGSNETDRVWVTTAYIRYDRDGDGIDELLEVVLGSGSGVAGGGNSVLLGIEEVDSVPLSSWTPIPITHTYYGMSLADLTLDLQKIGTSMLRQQLDNWEQVTTSRTIGNDNVNVDDVLDNQNGAHIRVTGTNDARASLAQLAVAPLPPQSFQLVEHLNERRVQRTGAGESSLDVTSLSNVNTGVATLAYDQAKAKLEVYARNAAELMLKPLFRDIHELLQKHSTKPMVMRLRNKWVEVKPGSWRSREDVKVNVGVGRATVEKKRLALMDVMERQTAVNQAGGTGVLLSPEHMYNSLSDYTDLLGLSAERYWMDPATAQPPEPGPDYNMLQLQIQDKIAQAQLMSAQAKQAQIMLDGQKAQAQLEHEDAKASLELEDKRERLELDRQTTAAKLVALEQESAIKADEKVAEEERKRLEIVAKDEQARSEEERKRMELLMKDEDAQADRDAEMAKAMLASATAIATKSGEDAPIEQGFSTVSQLMAQIQASMDELRDERSRPKQVVRDANGLILSIGDRQVVRDESGRVMSL